MDSDTHTLMFVKDSDGSKIYDSEDDVYLDYDSDKHTIIVEELDSDGLWVRDSEGNLLPYDSDTSMFPRRNRFSVQPDRFNVYNYHSISYRPDSENNNGVWVDSEGTFVSYDSDRYVTRVFEQVQGDNIPTTTDGLQGLFVDSDSLNGTFVLDSDRVYTLYDSDKHNSFFFDSDSDNKLNLNQHIDKLYVSTSVLDKPQTYHLIYNSFPRYTRVWNVVRYHKETVLLGSRFTFNDNKERRRNDYKFEELFKQEDVVLNEPIVDYDYSKQGQVGIPIPDTIVGINKIFRIDNFSGMGMWNYEYQFFLNNFDYFYGNGGASMMPMTNYYVTKMKVYEVNDPEVYGDVYKNSWLKRYATARAKMQWGSNLKKYSNTNLPGGLMLDGQALYDEGKEESDALEQELKSTSLEMDFFVG